MIFAFKSENQVVIRKISVKYIDPKFVQELNNILKVSHLPAVFPVEVFAGHRMPDREIGVIGVPSDIESALISVRNMVHRQKHDDQCLRLGTDFDVVYCGNISEFRIFGIDLIFFVSPFFQLFGHRAVHFAAFLEQKSSVCGRSENCVEVGVVPVCSEIHINRFQLGVDVLEPLQA